MKPKSQFGRIAKAQPVKSAKPVNHDREERAAIHEFDGKLSREEAEARAARECQHCGQAAKLGTIFRADYGYNLDVCSACAGALKSQGWENVIQL